MHTLRLGEMHLTRILDTIADLPHAARRDLGLTGQATYWMLWHAYTLLIRALDAGTPAIPHNHPEPPPRPGGGVPPPARPAAPTNRSPSA
ncbi:MULTISPECIES: hypothetical protein [unclassified Streptomyces]|uniref:hypothetical protein n=1 Tax=Streptomyces sp. NPDC127532 TaxID=3345399 RepID=UPI003641D03C